MSEEITPTQEEHSKFKSRKWISIWIVESILTLFVVYGCLTHVEDMEQLIDLVNIWINFTLVSIVYYGAANVSEKWLVGKDK